MRLDRFLKVSRLLPQRTRAKEFCDQGRVRLNDRPAKAAASVRPDDRIEVRWDGRIVRFRVVSLPQGQLSRREARELVAVESSQTLES